MKRKMALLLSITFMLISVPMITAHAEPLEEEPVIETDIEEYSYTMSVGSSLSFTGSTAYCSSDVYGKSSCTRIEGTQKLQKKVWWGWSTVEYWTDYVDGRILHMNNTATVTESGKYRVRIEARVYSGNNYEDVYCNSTEVSYPYHVGEDNFDIVDSLRAIDEAIQFLELRSGCRLGHATYLGIPPKQYYDKTQNSISLPAQVWLDNAVWMYYFLKENSITFEGSSLLMHYLEEQYSIFFKDIYQKALASGNLDHRLENLPKGIYTDPPCDHEQCTFNMHNYYLSWMLRGDEPGLYTSGYLERPDSVFENHYPQLKNSE